MPVGLNVLLPRVFPSFLILSLSKFKLKDGVDVVGGGQGGGWKKRGKVLIACQSIIL